MTGMPDMGRPEYMNQQQMDVFYMDESMMRRSWRLDKLKLD